MLITAMLSTTAKISVARENSDEPNRHTRVLIHSTSVPYRYKYHEPSGKNPCPPRDTPIAPTRLSTQPSTFIAALNACPKKNTRPIDPPNSGPSDREIR